VSLRRTLPEHQRDLGALDAAAIERVRGEARPAPRDADELHDALLGYVVAPVDEAWRSWLEELARQGRAGAVGRFAFAIENARAVEALFPQAARAALPARLEAVAGAPVTRDDAMLAAVRGHSEVVGPFTIASLAEALDLPGWEVEAAAARLESEGAVLRGRFTPGGSEEELCDRRLLARIHRYTLDRLRSEIEPVSAQDFVRYLLERHRLTARSRAGGRAGLRDAIGQLQGFEIAAAAWERDVLGARVAGYRSEWLDELCLTGEVTWGRLSPRKSSDAGATARAAMGSTSRATPITLAMRRDLPWLLDAVRGASSPEAPVAGPAVAALEALRRRGALFLDDLALASNLPSGEVAAALWDLVGRGLVASDGFQPLRVLMTSGRSRGPSHAAQGRWSIIEDPVARAAPDDLADKVAGQLLSRYGVVFRELTARESFVAPWRDVLRALRRREARGLVRGGRFVAGFLGEQYALPEAVEALRRVRREERTGEVVRVRAADPLNLVGIVTPGPRIPAHHGPWLVLRDGAFERGEERAAG
jgi:ATP-dependent Lhr-like helicase